MGPPYGDDSLPAVAPFSASVGVTDSPTLARTVEGVSRAVTAGDVHGVDCALGELAAEADLTSSAAPSALALAECLRARADLAEGRVGGANLAAQVAVALIGSAKLDADPRVTVHVLVTAASVAATTAQVERARVRATEALAVAQAALGPTDVDTGAAWMAVSAACQAAGDGIGANAARKQALAIQDLT